MRKNSKVSRGIKLGLIIFVPGFLFFLGINLLSFEYEIFLDNSRGREEKLYFKVDEEVLLDTSLSETDALYRKTIKIKGGFRTIKIETLDCEIEKTIFVFKKSVGHISIVKDLEDWSSRCHFSNNWFGIHYSPSPISRE